MKPDFVIGGAPRCGTTWLARNLGEHPGIYVARGAEAWAAGDLHFFDVNNPAGRENHARGTDWYFARFDAAAPGQKAGEKTADYLCDPDAARLLADTLGTVRLIFLLRHPAERAWSHYWHSRHRLPPALGFDEIVAAGRDPGDVRVLSAGYYHEHLSRFLALFPREALHVVLQEDLRADPLRELRAVCAFLGVDPAFDFPLAGTRINAASASRVSAATARAGRWLRRQSPGLYGWLIDGPLSAPLHRMIRAARGKTETAADETRPAAGYPALDAAARRALMRLYRDDTRKLGEWLGRDLSAAWPD